MILKRVVKSKRDKKLKHDLEISSDGISDEEISQDSARAVKSTSSSVRSRKSMSEQSLSHVTPSNSRLERTFSDSTTRSAYQIIYNDHG